MSFLRPIRTSWLALGLAAAFACAPLTAAADAADDLRFGYGYLGGSLLLEDNGRFSGQGSGLRLGLGQRVHPRWGYELSVFHHDFDSEVANGGGNWREYGGALEGLYYYTDHPRWMPYFAVGGGLIRSKERFRNATVLPPGQWESNDVFGAVGVGLLYRRAVGRHDWGLRGDYRYRFFDIGDIPGINPFEEHVFSLGLVLRFGARAAVVPVPAVTDAGPSVAAAAEATTSVTAEAPETVAVAATEAAPRPEVEPVGFPHDSAELTDHARALLVQWAPALKAWLAADAGRQLTLVGHADNVGPAAYNQQLSLRRAEALRAGLVRWNVPAARLAVDARGFSQPVASNDDADGRARNRRAEIVFSPD